MSLQILITFIRGHYFAMSLQSFRTNKVNSTEKKTDGGKRITRLKIVT